MSREIDPENMTQDDVEYVRQRPSLRREFLMQGFGDPLDPDYEGLAEKPEEDESEEGKARREAEEAAKEREEAETREREARQAEADAAAAAAAEGGAGPDDSNKDPDSPVEPDELPESKQWTKSMDKADLEKVVQARNEDYEDDEQIVVEGTGKDGKVTKADLVSALEQDDRELAGDTGE